jgi:replication factor C large subunit
MSEDWTELYRPKSLKDVVGNPKAIKELKDWAISWESGTPVKRVAVLIGSPGVGKTSAALALAIDFDWGVIEMNASDHRNGEAIRRIALRGALSDTFTDAGEYLSHREGRKKLIILDEADNIFGREDQGGVPAIVELIGRTQHPVILIVNDFYALSRKSSAIKDKTLQIKFGRIQTSTVKGLLRRIAADRGLNAPDRVLEIIANNSNGDLRAALRDLQAIGLGNDDIREEQAKIMDNRLTSKTNYEIMAEIFHGSSPTQARLLMIDAQEDPEHLLLWVEENLPIAYKDAEDLVRGFRMLSRADMFLGRVKKRQYFRFWSYATDLMSFGVCAAKQRPHREYVRYQFPSYLMKMSRSKGQRAIKQAVGLKLGSACHISIKGAQQEVLPYFMVLYRGSKEFQLATTIDLGLDQEEVAFLLDEKVDSSAVKHLMQAVARKIAGESEEHDLKTTRLEQVVERPKDDKPAEEAQKQRSLFEY